MGGKLPRKQEQAIGALLIQPTIGEAAQALGVGESTLRRWLEDATFQESYRQARRKAVGHAIARLQQVSTKAVDALGSLLDDETTRGSVRVSAARAVLDLAIRGIELEDLEERIVALVSPADGQGRDDMSRLHRRLRVLERHAHQPRPDAHFIAVLRYPYWFGRGSPRGLDSGGLGVRLPAGMSGQAGWLIAAREML